MLAAVATSLAMGRARADGLRATAEPGYGLTETDVTDQAGATTHERREVLTQRYRLSLDRPLTDQLVAAAGATLLDERGWRRAGGISSDEHGRSTSLFGRLTLGTPVLTAGLGADRRDQRALSSSATGFASESYTAYASWRPVGLPELDLRGGRVNAFDASRRAQDTTTDSAMLGARYQAPAYDLRYLLTWTRSDDHLHRAESTAVEQTVLATRSDSLFGRRTSTYLSGRVQSRSTATVARGEGGKVTRQQLPVGGLSAVLAFPATRTDVTLSPNPAVVDGNTEASASVNVGFGAGPAADLREVGARFADLVTPVNTIYVWLHRRPTPAVELALTAPIQVFESDDNLRWTEVTVPTRPILSPLENRIEIGIPQKQARYLKVTLRPLDTGVTTDATYREIFVTEIQFLLVLDIALVPRRLSDVTLGATALARTMILRAPELAHDVSLAISRQSEASLTTYSIVNGLSLAHRLRPNLATNARVARTDQDSGRGREGVWEWSAALLGRPLPTASWSLAYSGNASTRDDRTAHSVSALARADWYDGISTQANAAASMSTQGLRVARTVQTSGTTSLTPNRIVTVTAGALYSYTLRTAPDMYDLWTQFVRVDGSVSLTPAPALSAAGTVSRVVIGARPTTLATVQLNYFPLRGELQLSVAYSKTLDTEAEATSEVLSPSLRWNLRRGVSLTASYTALQNVAPVEVLASRAFAANLLITL